MVFYEIRSWIGFLARVRKNSVTNWPRDCTDPNQTRDPNLNDLCGQKIQKYHTPPRSYLALVFEDLGVRRWARRECMWWCGNIDEEVEVKKRGALRNNKVWGLAMGRSRVESRCLSFFAERRLSPGFSSFILTLPLQGRIKVEFEFF